MTIGIGTRAGAAPRDGALRTLPAGAARVVPAGAPRHVLVRTGLTLPLLAGAAWFVGVAVRSSGTALGSSAAPSFAAAVAAIIVVPAAVGFAWPLLDACLTLVLGRNGHVTWSRILTESLGALILAACTTMLDSALWPGMAALALAATLGLLFGFRHWQPQALAGERPLKVPVVLLLFDEPRAVRQATTAVVRPIPLEPEEEAA